MDSVFFQQSEKCVATVSAHLNERIVALILFSIGNQMIAVSAAVKRNRDDDYYALL